MPSPTLTSGPGNQQVFAKEGAAEGKQRLWEEQQRTTETFIRWFLCNQWVIAALVKLLGAGDPGTRTWALAVLHWIVAWCPGAEIVLKAAAKQQQDPTVAWRAEQLIGCLLWVNNLRRWWHRRILDRLGGMLGFGGVPTGAASAGELAAILGKKPKECPLLKQDLGVLEVAARANPPSWGVIDSLLAGAFGLR
jgi:hypothetical protein